ncbi:MAG: hypothetical protein IT462_05245 [Planctomycetes bacterium]|nr:hypothetical protein [Planctomycetota bacterium]
MSQHAQEVVCFLTAATVRAKPKYRMEDMFFSREAGRTVAFGCYAEIRVREIQPFAMKIVIEAPTGNQATLWEDVVHPTSNLVPFVAERLWHARLEAGNWAIHVFINDRLEFTRVIEVVRRSKA